MLNQRDQEIGLFFIFFITISIDMLIIISIMPYILISNFYFMTKISNIFWWEGSCELEKIIPWSVSFTLPGLWIKNISISSSILWFPSDEELLEDNERFSQFEKSRNTALKDLALENEVIKNIFYGLLKFWDIEKYSYEEDLYETFLDNKELMKIIAKQLTFFNTRFIKEESQNISRKVDNILQLRK